MKWRRVHGHNRSRQRRSQWSWQRRRSGISTASGAFTTKGAEKRKQHGCKGAHVFRDPNESDRVWAIFDWDEAGWQSFTADPEVPAIFQEAGFTQGPPKSAEFLRQHDA